MYKKIFFLTLCLTIIYLYRLTRYEHFFSNNLTEYFKINKYDFTTNYDKLNKYNNNIIATNLFINSLNNLNKLNSIYSIRYSFGIYAIKNTFPYYDQENEAGAVVLFDGNLTSEYKRYFDFWNIDLENKEMTLKIYRGDLYNFFTNYVIVGKPDYSDNEYLLRYTFVLKKIISKAVFNIYDRVTHIQFNLDAAVTIDPTTLNIYITFPDELKIHGIIFRTLEANRARINITIKDINKH
uniref:Uncharacterized protein n=1 Tax=Megaviridae environmental sample TaxID=1737588 RepID=A0A5J6VMJ9_9VIRU|nr:MAG: hypothetical protein [Megaviridae environmental sample]